MWCLCCADTREVDAVLLHHKKDLRRVDKEVLVVRVDVGHLVGEYVREVVVVRVRLSERRSDSMSRRRGGRCHAGSH